MNTLYFGPHHILLEDLTINDRTIVATFDQKSQTGYIVLFNLLAQPNKLSKMMPETTWGFVTGYIQNIPSAADTAELVELYIRDMENDKFWWEDD